MSWIKKIFRFCAYILYLVVVVAISLEIIFRILPTSNPFFLAPLTDESDILRFYPNQTTTHSLGADFYKIIVKHTNNYGFISSFDYSENSNPDVIVIGDSYVEAMQVSNEDSIGEVIAELANDASVYQMGISGAPLSQYIQMLRYADSKFAANEYVIVIVGNDFDESLCSYSIKEGTWCFDDEAFELKFIPFEGYSRLRYVAKNSAFLRYLIFNVGFNWKQLMSSIGLVDPGMSAASQYAGNTERIKSDDIKSQSIEVINKFFDAIDDMGLTQKITLILDADRTDIYNNTTTESFFNDMRNHVLKRADFFGVKIIDMEDVFRNDFEQHGSRFEFPTDGHWNERAHRLAAEAFIKQRQKD